MRQAESTRGFHHLLDVIRKQVMRMSDFEIFSIILAIIGLLISAYKLGKDNSDK